MMRLAKKLFSKVCKVADLKTISKKIFRGNPTVVITNVATRDISGASWARETSVSFTVIIEMSFVFRQSTFIIVGQSQVYGGA